jgi:hypothetical protein
MSGPSSGLVRGPSLDPINRHHQTGAVDPVGAGSAHRENCKCNAERQSTFAASSTPTENDPTGKSRGQLIAPRVQPLLKKYSDFPKPQISPYMRRPVPSEGRFAIVMDAGRDAVDAGSAEDESAFLADGEVVWS